MPEPELGGWNWWDREVIGGYVFNLVSHAPIPGATVTLLVSLGSQEQTYATQTAGNDYDSGYYEFDFWQKKDVGLPKPIAVWASASSYQNGNPQPLIWTPSSDLFYAYSQNIWLTPGHIVVPTPIHWPVSDSPRYWQPLGWANAGGAGWWNSGNAPGPPSPEVVAALRKKASGMPIPGKGPSPRRKRPSRRRERKA